MHAEQAHAPASTPIPHPNCRHRVVQDLWDSMGPMRSKRLLHKLSSASKFHTKSHSISLSTSSCLCLCLWRCLCLCLSVCVCVCISAYLSISLCPYLCHFYFCHFLSKSLPPCLSLSAFVMFCWYVCLSCDSSVSNEFSTPPF